MNKTLLQILKEVSEIIAVNDNISSVMNAIVDILAENLNVDVCSIYIYDNKENTLSLKATHGLNPNSIGKIKLQPGAGITGTAFAQAEAINLASADEYEKYQFFPNSGEDKFKAFLACPLIIGSKNLGVLNLQKVTSGQFPDEVVDMVRALGTQIANLVLSSKMLSEISKKNPDIKKSFLDNQQVVLKGIKINNGIVSGTASVYALNDFFDVPVTTDLSLEDESKLFIDAVALTKTETVKLLEKAIAMISEADASIFDVHLMFLEDKSLISSVLDIIKDKKSAEYALKTVNAKFQKLFSNMKDEIFREKSADLKDVMLRLLKNVENLKYTSSTQDSTIDAKDKIIVAKELLPSDIFRLTSGSVAGIVTEKGGATSHVSILAKALNIPALLGVSNLMSHVADGKNLILDCNTGLCYINPNSAISDKFSAIENAHIPLKPSKGKCISCTNDGQKIFLRANVSLVSETTLLKKYHADGIGLYRTEFLYMIRDYLPSEQVQYNVFSAVMNNAKGMEVTFRLLDVGGDKPLPYLPRREESNPALGKRGIRLLLEREDILRPHLKAMLRAGVNGKIKIICPMISTLSEFLQLKKIVDDCKSQLLDKNIPFAENCKLGIMLEVPSAYLDLQNIVQHADCVSIGTNDLFQYTFACDRETVAFDAAPVYFQTPFINMLAHSADIVNSAGKDLSICGEMAADPLALPLILGAGIHDLSMQSNAIFDIATTMQKYSLDECRSILLHCKSLTDAEEVLAYMKQIAVSKGN
jgi:phosphotransferase system enzyme I (PtsP)